MIFFSNKSARIKIANNKMLFELTLFVSKFAILATCFILHIGLIFVDKNIHLDFFHN